jgi:hypothetical protein
MTFADYLIAAIIASAVVAPLVAIGGGDFTEGDQ